MKKRVRKEQIKGRKGMEESKARGRRKTEQEGKRERRKRKEKGRMKRKERVKKEEGVGIIYILQYTLGWSVEIFFDRPE